MSTGIQMTKSTEIINCSQEKKNQKIPRIFQIIRLIHLIVECVFWLSVLATETGNSKSSAFLFRPSDFRLTLNQFLIFFIILLDRW